ncbi:nucleoside 2-deoxyribosyltransferase [Halotalea alkalilenta]|uniref:Nucleoside 2-deoxyribosyltransferase n=1 Tax=Halotalea alkalilenta TaxID=376489 RepID=A0A172YIY3_9GAMM|nr:nucleoside 2-deoxyribosyltransferase [Halotalea alkalilenta]ANF59146.1 hypothetical protein A5892_18140 [Halotalea alkalilenta]
MAERIYFAGPEVFHPDAETLAAQAHAQASARGFEAMTPMDNRLPALADGAAMRAAIFHKNLALLDRAELVVANLSPFRGPSADAGTIWEIGYAFARGVPVFAWSDCPGDYRSRVVDDGLRIEDFDGFDNLMISESIIAPLHPNLAAALDAAALFLHPPTTR